VPAQPTPPRAPGDDDSLDGSGARAMQHETAMPLEPTRRPFGPRRTRPLWLAAVAVAALAGCGDDPATPSTEGDAAIDAAGDTDAGATDVGLDDTTGSDTGDAGTDDVATDTAPDADVGSDTTDAGTDIDDVIDAADAADALDVFDGDVLEVTIDAHCDNTNGRVCLLPWPSDRWLADGADTVTGYGMALESDAIPTPVTGAAFDTTPFERLDGFSPSTQIITLFAEPVDVTGLAGVDDIGRSLDEDHPTVLLDLETGERVAHWVENDARAESDDETLFYLRPATRLAADRTYGVAIRGLDGVSGAAIEADPVFAALRDGVRTNARQLEARRPTFETLFDALGESGVARDELVAAWSFHTASDEAIRSRMFAMRADALERLGDDGLGCTVTAVDEDFGGRGARRVRGTYAVPWYLTAPRAPATFVYDEDGDPAFQGTEEVAFTAIVPASLLESDAPGPLVTWGHGLFGNAEGSLSGRPLIDAADAFGAVMVGTDWHGMSSSDLGFLATALSDVSNFYMLGENLQQGMVNMMTLTRSMLGDCRLLPELARVDGEPAIDPETNYFIGGSQGSILGATHLALSPDTDRGILFVGGANFSFMIERSIHFTRFETLLAPFYGSRLNTGMLMVLSQSVWDDAETAAWIGIATEGSDETTPKEFIYLVAENDAQVPNLSSDIAARIAGIPVLTGSARTPWGVPVEDAPVTGSAYVSFGGWDAPPVGGNVSPEVDDGGHGAVGFTPESITMVDRFFATGEIIVPCAPDCSDVTP